MISPKLVAFVLVIFTLLSAGISLGVCPAITNDPGA